MTPPRKKFPPGQGLVEFALVFPVLFLMVVAIFQIFTISDYSQWAQSHLWLVMREQCIDPMALKYTDEDLHETLRSVLSEDKKETNVKFSTTHQFREGCSDSFTVPIMQTYDTDCSEITTIKPNNPYDPLYTLEVSLHLEAPMPFAGLIPGMPTSIIIDKTGYVIASQANIDASLYSISYGQSELFNDYNGECPPDYDIACTTGLSCSYSQNNYANIADVMVHYGKFINTYWTQLLPKNYTGFSDYSPDSCSDE